MHMGDVDAQQRDLQLCHPPMHHPPLHHQQPHCHLTVMLDMATGKQVGLELRKHGAAQIKGKGAPPHQPLLASIATQDFLIGKQGGLQARKSGAAPKNTKVALGKQYQYWQQQWQPQQQQKLHLALLRIAMLPSKIGGQLGHPKRSNGAAHTQVKGVANN